MTMLKAFVNTAAYKGLRLKRVAQKAAYDITPPLIWRSLFKLSRPDHSAAVINTKAYANRLSLKDTHPTQACYRYGSPVLDIPAHKVRYATGMSYLHPEHQMQRYYQEGIEGLSNYYAKHHPTNIFEKHFLKSPRTNNVPKNGFPWCDFDHGLYYPADSGEKGLNADHGVQHYGPVSTLKVSLEAERLNILRKSIKQNGFMPEHGFPTGYFLCNAKDDWVFVTMSGQHRTATFLHLGFEYLPAQTLPTMPRIVHECDVSHWPMVANQELSKAEALTIFHAFFPNERELIFAKN